MFKIVLNLAFLFLIGSCVFAQQDQLPDLPRALPDAVANQLQLEKKPLESMQHELAFQTRWLQSNETLWWADTGLLMAPDGHYGANTPEELQTYLDLDMDYQYIESDSVRKLLNLNDGSGIIIKSVAENGLGQQAGFQAGDLVLQVDETPVDTQYKFVIAVTGSRGRPTAARLRRGNEEQVLSFKLQPVQLQDAKRWIIGVSVDEMSDVLKVHLGTSGAVITEITDDTPAQKMGLHVNDIIVKIGDSEISNPEDLKTAVQATQGNSVSLELIRNGKKMNVELEPKQVDDELEVAFKFDNVPALNEIPYVGRLYRNALPDSQPQLMVPHRIQWVVPDSAKGSGTLENKLDELSKQIQTLQEQVETIMQAIDK